MTNLADNLIRSALRHPTRPAVRLDETVLSYGELSRYAPAAGRPSTLSTDFIRDLLAVTGGGHGKTFWTSATMR